MDAEDVEQTLAGRGIVSRQLGEEPGEIVLVAVRGPVGQVAPAIRRSPLLIVAAVEVPGPAPLLGTHDQSPWIDRFDLGRVGYRISENFTHLGADRVHVTVGRLPDTGLVIEQIVTDPTVC